MWAKFGENLRGHGELFDANLDDLSWNNPPNVSIAVLPTNAHLSATRRLVYLVHLCHVTDTFTKTSHTRADSEYPPQSPSLYITVVTEYVTTAVISTALSVHGITKPHCLKSPVTHLPGGPPLFVLAEGASIMCPADRAYLLCILGGPHLGILSGSFPKCFLLGGPLPGRPA